MLIVIIEYSELFWKAGKRKYLLHTLQLVSLYQDNISVNPWYDPKEDASESPAPDLNLNFIARTNLNVSVKKY